MREALTITIFVASPSGLEVERQRVEDLVRELNLTWAPRLGCHLELVRWETHGVPSVGDGLQEIVNSTLPNDYDIFIGLMSHRFGTPTTRFESGTEEEFNRALQRHRANPGSVRIMFYFKEADVPLRDIEPDQLRRVQGFRASLGDEGTLYWTFESPDDLIQRLREHLSRQLPDLASSAAPQASCTESQEEADEVVPAAGPAESHDEGLLDYLDSVDAYFQELSGITSRIGNETQDIGAKMAERTAEIEAAKTRGAVGRHEARKMFDRAAADMMHYVVRMRTELPLFADTMHKGTDAAAKAVLLSASLNAADAAPARTARTTLATFRNSLDSGYSGTESFRDSVQGIPRMTVALNRAKRETSAVLQDLLDHMDQGRRMITETIVTLDRIIAQQEAEEKQDS